jgi:hypothetical protein
VRQTANGGASYLEFTLANTTEACIREVSALLAYHSATNAANNGKASSFDGATESIMLNGAMSSTSVAYVGVIATPAAASWSQAAVNGLVGRVGYSTDTSPNPYWDGIVIEAAVA